MTPGAGQPGRIGLTEDMRDHILSAPEAILGDAEVMRALIAANDRAMGENIVDLRGAAMRRLEGRLDRLEDTHRSVIAAAYENLAGTNLVHRAVLQLLEPASFDAFLTALTGTIAATLRVDSVVLVLESPEGDTSPPLAAPIRVMGPGSVHTYLTGVRGGGTLRPVVLRQLAEDASMLHGTPNIRSEAAMRLDLGAGRLPGMLVLGAVDPQQFRAGQGTDLLAFFAASFERVMRRWLS